MQEQKIETKEKRIGGYLHRVITMFDKTGKMIDFTLTPLMVEFRPRDLMQDNQEDYRCRKNIIFT